MNKDGTPKWRYGSGAARSVLEGRHAERLPGRGSWTMLKSTPLEASQGSLALCPVLRLQDDLAERRP